MHRRPFPKIGPPTRRASETGSSTADRRHRPIRLKGRTGWVCTVLLALGFWAGAAAPTAAAPRFETPWFDGPEGRLRLLAGGGAKDSRWLGLSFDLEPGWKIFWRSPGAPGLPPMLDWQGSQNLNSVRIAWPAPEIFTSFGFKARGYGGRFTLPMQAAVRNPARPLRARVHVRYQVCKDVCIPGEARLALTVPAGAPPHPAIVAARARVPRPAGNDFAVWQAERRERRLIVRIGHRSRTFAAPVVLIEAPGSVRLGRSSPLPPDRAGRFGVAVPILGKRPVPKAFRVHITLIGDGQSWEKSVPVLPVVDR